jgi:hypothetical protein
MDKLQLGQEWITYLQQQYARAAAVETVVCKGSDNST